MQPQISICIPAYKRTQFLKRLLESIRIQSYTNFEVIVTDDSPTNEVADLCKEFRGVFSIRHHKNPTQLGTPQNWNAAIGMASGPWIKLMHDDDWFSSADSLREFATAVASHHEVDFFFSSYNNVKDSTGEVKELRPRRTRLQRVIKNPSVLLASNIIGPPSVTLYKNDASIIYDASLKWLVDIDFYMSYLTGKKLFYIDQPLVNIGISDEQVTQNSFQVADVELPENFKVLNKIGQHQLDNLLVFDAWWRLIRNLDIKNASSIAVHGYKGNVPQQIQSMIKIQRRIPAWILKNGFSSKVIMLICYLSKT
jgi:glycosyltransferase involved in cell wall biosynthesis